MSAVLRAEWEASDRVAVRSSNVAEVSWVKDFGRLFVKFKSGKVYAYQVGPDGPGLYAGLLAAPSKGVFVHAILRNKGRDDRYPVRGPF